MKYNNKSIRKRNIWICLRMTSSKLNKTCNVSRTKWRISRRLKILRTLHRLKHNYTSWNPHTTKFRTQFSTLIKQFMTTKIRPQISSSFPAKWCKIGLQESSSSRYKFRASVMSTISSKMLLSSSTAIIARIQRIAGKKVKMANTTKRGTKIISRSCKCRKTWLENRINNLMVW